jgi:endonuclease/exonuclease/phosphatase family metal-dependent hydrolase
VPTITVATYNVYGARHRAPLRAVVRALNADVLVVNEAPKLPWLWRRQCDRLARSWLLRRACGGRDSGSTMICVSGRVSVEQVSARRLAQPRFAPCRGVVAAQCRLGRVSFGVVGVHLSLMQWSRPAEAHEALAEAAALSGPVILGGDLNETPDRSCWRMFAAGGLVDRGGHDALTWRSDRPDRRIDALLVRGAEVRAHGVPDLPSPLLSAASDHLPVVATVELDDRAT